tara:strand:- start:1918 stop:2655 length:738 start_codon:yes stop_codon:yes gene_type:complete
MSVFLSILVATAAVSILSLSGVVLLAFRDHLLQKVTIFLVALAAGALMGTAFLHLLPEALDNGFSQSIFLYPLIGFITFFLFEKIFHWHHTHRKDTSHAPLGALSLIGDFLHNFLDGIILAAAFLLDIKLGVIAAGAVALHEIPQEISEFGVLVYAGFSKTKALLLNFLSATSVIFGGVAGYFIGGAIESAIPFVIMFAVGTFLYLAASDFVPEIRKVHGLARSFQTFLVFGVGIALMWVFTYIE